MINYTLEKKLDLSTKQILSIFDFAAQAANDNGLMSSYVFNKALLVFAAIIYYPELKDKVTAEVGADYDISIAFDNLNAADVFDKMLKEHGETLVYLDLIGEQWFADTCAYMHSARGLIDSLNTLSGDVVKSAVEQLQKISKNEDIQSVLQIGEKLGVNLRQDSSLKEAAASPFALA